MSRSESSQLAAQMREFLGEIPPSAGLDWTLDEDFLRHFEAERFLLIRAAIERAGFSSEREFSVLDFGYLHGLMPEFLHRAFPGARFTVLDHPGSPNFSDPAYQSLIARRTYLRLLPCRIEDCAQIEGRFDVIVLGEIVEHLDPTVVAGALTALRSKINPGGLLVITTPNGAGLYNSARTLLGEDALWPPIPHPTMGLPHIHLWSATVLARTLEHAGWRPGAVSYYHGREGEVFARANRGWHSLKHQLFIKLTHALTHLRPSWRGFFVISAQPTA